MAGLSRGDRTVRWCGFDLCHKYILYLYLYMHAASAACCVLDSLLQLHFLFVYCLRAAAAVAGRAERAVCHGPRRRAGQGRYVDASGVEMEGTFANGILAGSGTVVDFKNKAAYSGRFVNGLLHGVGSESARGMFRCGARARALGTRGRRERARAAHAIATRGGTTKASAMGAAYSSTRRRTFATREHFGRTTSTDGEGRARARPAALKHSAGRRTARSGVLDCGHVAVKVDPVEHTTTVS